MAYKNEEYYWIQVLEGGKEEVAQYAETHTIDKPLYQRFLLCGSNWGVRLDQVHRVGPRVEPWKSEG